MKRDHALDFALNLPDYQYLVVRLHDKGGKPVMAYGDPVEFFGTDSVDLPNCYYCHGDNVSGNLLSPWPGSTSHKTVKAMPLTKAVNRLGDLKTVLPIIPHTDNRKR